MSENEYEPPVSTNVDMTPFAFADTGGSYSFSLIAGRYDIVSDGAWNPRLLVAENAMLDQDTTLDVDVQTAVVTGRVTIDRDAIPSGRYASARFVRQSRPWADALVDASSNYRKRLATGTYDVYFVPESQGDLPVIGGLIARGIVVTGDTRLDLDVPTAWLTIDVSANHGPLPAEVHLLVKRTDGANAQADVVVPASGQTSLRVARGIYDFSYVKSSEAGLPANAEVALATGVDISGATSLDLDIPFREVSGELLSRGAPIGSDQVPQLFFQERTRPDRQDGHAPVVDAPGGHLQTRLAPGDYFVHYAAPQGATSLPTNTEHYLGCIRVR